MDSCSDGEDDEMEVESNDDNFSDTDEITMEDDVARTFD